MTKDIQPGRYRHFKGREYEVLCIATHSETLEPMVVYKALYGEGGVWVRPASMWNETVERDGQNLSAVHLSVRQNHPVMPRLTLRKQDGIIKSP